MTVPENQEPSFSAPPQTITCDGMVCNCNLSSILENMDTNE
jgi:hypothetical protein